MTTQHARQLEEFAAVLDDADAWDALARLGWRLVDYGSGIETWEKDGAVVTRRRTSHPQPREPMVLHPRRRGVWVRLPSIVDERR